MNANRPARTAIAAAWMSVGFYLVGVLGISMPPFSHGLDSVKRWADERSMVEVVMGFLRLGGHLICGYLLVVSVAALIARLTRWRWLARLTGLLTPSRLRPLVGVVAGASVAVGAATSMIAHDTDRPTVATMYAEEPEVPVAEFRAVLTATPSAPTATVIDTTIIDAEIIDLRDTWVIRPGDNLWVVAEETLQDAWGRRPTDEEILPYWRQLIELNRDVLVDRDAPDFVYSGQVFHLPRVPKQ